MVAISFHPVPSHSSLIHGYNNLTPWSIQGILRLQPGTDPNQATPTSPTPHPKSAYTVSSALITLNVSSGTQAAGEGSGLFGRRGSTGTWNGLEHKRSEVELVPRTHTGANACVVNEGESVDLPFKFEFTEGLPPTCEVERGRYNAFCRFRLVATVEGRPHRAKHLLEPRKTLLEYDIPVPFYDAAQIQQLLHPHPQTWTGSTDELEWEVGVNSLVFSPTEFSKVHLKASLHNQKAGTGPVSLVENSLVGQPRTEAAASLGTDTRKSPAAFIRRATFEIWEGAVMKLFDVGASPLMKATRGAPNHAPSLIASETGGGSVRILKVQVDGENLEHGHQLTVQLPGLSPVLPTPGSKMDGKFKAVIDRRMSTGDTVGFAETAVQVNPSGSWGSFQITHTARVQFEVADGHNVIWETPIQISSATAGDSRLLVSEHPTVIPSSAAQSQQSSPRLTSAAVAFTTAIGEDIGTFGGHDGGSVSGRRSGRSSTIGLHGKDLAEAAIGYPALEAAGFVPAGKKEEGEVAVAEGY